MSRWQSIKKHLAQLAKPHKKEVRKAATAGVEVFAIWILSHFGLGADVTVVEVAQGGGLAVFGYFFAWLLPDGRK